MTSHKVHETDDYTERDRQTTDRNTQTHKAKTYRKINEPRPDTSYSVGFPRC